MSKLQNYETNFQLEVLFESKDDSSLFSKPNNFFWWIFMEVTKTETKATLFHISASIL